MIPAGWQRYDHKKLRLTTSYSQRAEFALDHCRMVDWQAPSDSFERNEGFYVPGDSNWFGEHGGGKESEEGGGEFHVEGLGTSRVWFWVLVKCRM